MEVRPTMTLSTVSQPLSLVQQVAAAHQAMEAVVMEDEALLHNSTFAPLETTFRRGTQETASPGSGFQH